MQPGNGDVGTGRQKRPFRKQTHVSYAQESHSGGTSRSSSKVDESAWHRMAARPEDGSERASPSSAPVTRCWRVEKVVGSTAVSHILVATS